MIRGRWWSSFKIFCVGFALLLGAAGALWMAQFRDVHPAPWVSMALASAAVACTIASIALDR